MNEKEKPKPIVIDISNIDTKSVKKQEGFLQEEGFEKVAELLNKEVKGKKNKNPATLQRSHNTIFINGQRGSGKTQFLISIKNYLKTENKKTLKKLYFIKSVDPTLLHDNESFLTIILAKILNQLEEENHLNDLSKEEQSEFYQHLTNVSSAIDGVIYKHNENKSSLEHISQDQTSLRLESYLNAFFYKVTQIVKKRKVVLLIDDIDMAFEKGFEVLEVIRKYLSSSYIVPIITGDEELYKTIVINHFLELTKKLNSKPTIVTYNFEINHNNSSDININTGEKEKDSEKNDRENILTLDFLTKVLPLDKRIKLKSIYQLAYNQPIIFKYQNAPYPFDRTSTNISYFYKQATIIFSNEQTNSSRFEKNLFENSLRRIIQFLHGEYQKDKKSINGQFSLVDIKTITNNSNKYNLNLLEGLRTHLTYLEDGKIYFQNNDFQKAENSLTLSIQQKKTYEALVLRGNTFIHFNKYRQASDDYKNAFKISKNIEVIKQYERIIEKVQAKHYSLKNAYLDLANMYDDIDNYDNAIRVYEISREKGQKKLELYLRLIEKYFFTNQFDKVKELEGLYPGNSEQVKTYRLLLEILNHILLHQNSIAEELWYSFIHNEKLTLANHSLKNLKRWSSNHEEKDKLLFIINKLEEKLNDKK